MTTLIGTNFGASTYATATNTAPVLGGGKGFSVGTRAQDYNGKEYVLAQAGKDHTAFAVLSIPSDTFVTDYFSTGIANASEIIGVVQYAMTSGDYGWVQIYGACKVKVLGACAKTSILYSTATGGSLDDATASNYQVTNIQILSTNPSATASAMSAFISYPTALKRAGTA